MITYFVTILFGLLTINSVHCTTEPELKFVQAIWRHGHRAPGELPYPKDKNGLNKWTRGWSQLSTLGMSQLHELGEFFRQRYGNFSGTTFNVNDIYVQSSDSDRAIESAQSFLTGFFPPTPTELFDQNVNWRPLPVHSNGPNQPDPLLKPTGFDCNSYDEFEKAEVDKLHQNWTKTYADVLEDIKINGGFSDNMTMKEAIGISSAIREFEYNMTIDDWLRKTWPNHNNMSTLEIALSMSSTERLAGFGTSDMAILRGGYLLNDWLDRAANVKNGTQKEPNKMMLYSAHDGTLLSLLTAMNFTLNETVPYAACIIMEIYEDKGQYFVKILYRQNLKYRYLVIKGCDVECPVEKMVALLNHRSIDTVSELQNYCKNIENTGVNGGRIDAAATSFNAAFLLCFVLVSLFLLL